MSIVTTGSRRSATKHLVVALTILAIAGTLSACGRYGRPVRPKAALPGVVHLDQETARRVHR